MAVTVNRRFTPPASDWTFQCQQDVLHVRTGRRFWIVCHAVDHATQAPAYCYCEILSTADTPPGHAVYSDVWVRSKVEFEDGRFVLREKT